MRPSGHHQRRKQARPQQSRSHKRPHEPARRVASDAEKRFLAGTAISPDQRIMLEKGSDDVSVRVLDLICPIGKGQRALIVAPPGTGKTTYLQKICNAVTKGYPEIKVFCVLIDERPEEVTDFKRSVTAEVFSSSMDQSQENHVKVIDEAMAVAFKEAAAGHDVLILLDSLTRLARVHNSQHNSGGKTLSGGVGAGALEVPRRIFGAARNTEDLGSITMIATILIETGSAMDSVIFEEFKGTGNMELVLSKKLAQSRLFPAVEILKSATRRTDLLFDPKEYKNLEALQRDLTKLDAKSAMEKLIQLLEKHPSSSDLLAQYS